MKITKSIVFHSCILTGFLVVIGITILTGLKKEPLQQHRSIPIYSPTPTRSVIRSLTPAVASVTSSPKPLNAILLTLTLNLPGIGSINRGNLHPLHPVRQVQITLYNIATHQTYVQTTTITFTGDYFSNPLISLSTVPAGNYEIFVKTNGFLQLKLVNTDSTNIFALIRGVPFVIPLSEMTDGDIDTNNTLDLNDYNLMLSCYRLPSLSPTTAVFDSHSSSCQHPQAADLDDNGTVDSIDYNILLKNLSQTTNGDGIPNGI